MLSETTVPHPGLTVRFEGLTAAQVAAVHEQAEKAITDAKVANGGELFGTRFVEVTKSEMKGADGTYTVLLTIITLLTGDLYQENAGGRGINTYRAMVQPSRQALNLILDAVDILPPKEVVTKFRG